MTEKNQEILKRFEEENKIYDEGQLHQEIKADVFGFGVTLVITLLLVIFKNLNNQPVFDLLGISFLGKGISDIFRYHTTKRKKALLAGIVLTVFGFLFILSYIVTVKGLV